MTIAVAILSAILGIAIGVLVSRVKGAQQASEALQNHTELEKQNAVLRSQMEAESRKVSEIRADAEKQLADARSASEKVLAQTKDEAAKALEQSKNEAAKNIADVKAEAAQALATAKDEAAKALEQAKNEAARTLANEKEAAEKRLESMKQDMERIHQKSLAEQNDRLTEMSQRLVAEAKNATEEMVKLREKEIKEKGDATMEQLVTPLKETIAKMEKTMNDTTLKQTDTNSALKEMLKQTIDSNASAKQTADDLIRAFKHDSKIQGDWGEHVLEELLEAFDLKKGIHFDVQDTLRDAKGALIVSEDSGNTMRPDVIIHLDSKKDVIVDSKVSMKDFLDYVSTDDSDQRKEFLKRHIDSLKKHVKELSTKDYSSYVKAPRKSIDFVIMFVPRSAALWTALHEEPTLWREAMDKNVFIADEQTLYAALRMVKLTWRQIEQAQNQQKVFELANEMLKRVGMFVKQMDSVGASLEKAQEAYKRGMSKFSEGGQSVLTTCRQLEKLGAKQDHNNPLPMTLEEIEYQEIEAEKPETEN